MQVHNSQADSTSSQAPIPSHIISTSPQAGSACPQPERNVGNACTKSQTGSASSQAASFSFPVAGSTSQASTASLQPGRNAGSAHTHHTLPALLFQVSSGSSPQAR